MKKLTLFFALIIFCNLADAQIVFDPANFSKNLVTAAQSARTAALVAQQYSTQIQQYMLLARDMKQLDQSVINKGIQRGYLPDNAAGVYTTADLLKQAAGVYSTYRATTNEMNALTQSYADLNQISNRLALDSKMSGYSVERVLEAEANAAAQGKSYAVHDLSRLQDALGQLNDHQAKADLLATQIPRASGSVQLLQVVASQNHLLSDQLSNLIQTSVSAAQAGQSEALNHDNDRQRSAEIARQADLRNQLFTGKTHERQ